MLNKIFYRKVGTVRVTRGWRYKHTEGQYGEDNSQRIAPGTTLNVFAKNNQLYVEIPYGIINPKVPIDEAPVGSVKFF